MITLVTNYTSGEVTIEDPEDVSTWDRYIKTGRRDRLVAKAPDEIRKDAPIFRDWLNRISSFTGVALASAGISFIPEIRT